MHYVIPGQVRTWSCGKCSNVHSALAIFFWIMPTSTGHRIVVLSSTTGLMACYFLLNYACTVWTIRCCRSSCPACYFLLNYACRVRSARAWRALPGSACYFLLNYALWRFCSLCPNILFCLLAIFFWIMLHSLLPVRVDEESWCNLLFSFELCKAYPPFYSMPLKYLPELAIFFWIMPYKRDFGRTQIAYDLLFSFELCSI